MARCSCHYCNKKGSHSSRCVGRCCPSSSSSPSPPRAIELRNQHHSQSSQPSGSNSSGRGSTHTPSRQGSMQSGYSNMVTPIQYSQTPPMMIPQGSATSLPHTSTPYYAQPGSSSYGYHNTTGLSEVAMGKLPAMGGSMHSLAGTASHRSGLSVQTHRSDMSDERQYQLSQESLEMAMEAAVLDDQVIDIILAKKPHIKKDELRRIRSNKSYHFILNTLNDYEKQTWTKSLIDLHIDYHAKQDEIKAYRDAYENARKSIKGAKSKNTGVTTKQFQHLIALANDWEEACERARYAREIFWSSYPNAYALPAELDYGHHTAIQDITNAKHTAHLEAQLNQNALNAAANNTGHGRPPPSGRTASGHDYWETVKKGQTMWYMFDHNGKRVWYKSRPQ